MERGFVNMRNVSKTVDMIITNEIVNHQFIYLYLLRIYEHKDKYNVHIKSEYQRLKSYSRRYKKNTLQ